MIERISERGISSIELMRAISSNFDDNLISSSGEVDLVSSAIPMTVLEEKAKLLKGIQFIFSSGVPSSSDLLEYENMQLRNENLVLREAIHRIEDRLAGIEASLPKENVIILREISREEAEKEILKLFTTGKTLYYSDVAQELKLDLELVVNICNKLQKQGQITIDDRAS